MTDAPGPISSTMAIAASALRAQQSRMRIIAENIANADSTSTTAGGTPYQRQVPVFTPSSVEAGALGVKMAGVRSDPTPFRSEYNPGHPSADAKGYVQLPNVDPLVEALDMKEAQRAYDANLNVIDSARAMTLRTLDIIKK
jgi:flagellar basal-body rod protein FlgC